jgi:hypothetical protein
MIEPTIQGPTIWVGQTINLSQGQGTGGCDGLLLIPAWHRCVVRALTKTSSLGKRYRASPASRRPLPSLSFRTLRYARLDKGSLWL